MEMAEAATAEVGLGWNSDTLPLGSHVCFYYLNEEMLKRTLAFLRVGLDDPDDFCVLFADEARSGRLLSWLEEGYGGAIQPLIDRGKLAVIGGAPTVDQTLNAIATRLARPGKDRDRLHPFTRSLRSAQPGRAQVPGVPAC